MAAFQRYIDDAMSYIYDTLQEVKPAAKDCLHLIPLYWIFCMARVPIHIIFGMIVASSYFGWVCIQWFINLLESAMLRFTKSQTLGHNIINALTSRMLARHGREDPVITTFWWIRLVINTLYIIWAAWKGWEITSKVHKSCDASQQSRQVVSSHSNKSSSSGPRIMVSGAFHHIPDDLRPDSSHSSIFYTPPTPPREQMTLARQDELPESPWSFKGRAENEGWSEEYRARAPHYHVE